MRKQTFALALFAAVGAAPAYAGDVKPNWPDIGRPVAVGGGENDAALVVGIDDYEYVADIPGADDNARDWYRYLVDGRKLGIRNVKLLRNGEADRETILQAAKETVALVKPGGAFWFVFIGHGAPSQDGKEGVLIGADTKQTAVSLFARSVKQSELQAIVGQTPAVMLFDSCFSGRAHNGSAVAAGLQPLILTKTLAPSTTTLLTAAQADQFAGGLPGKDRPAFSYLVLGALRGWGDANGDGQVTAAEAIEYATKALHLLPLGRTQTPELVGGGASRVLANRATEREPDLDAIITGEARVFPEQPKPGSASAGIGAHPVPDGPPSLAEMGSFRSSDAPASASAANRQAWGWGLLGTGVASALAGTALYFGTAENPPAYQDGDDLVTPVTTYQPAYLWGGLAGGAVLAGIGGYLLLNHPETNTPTARLRVGLGSFEIIKTF